MELCPRSAAVDGLSDVVVEMSTVSPSDPGLGFMVLASFSLLHNTNRYFTVIEHRGTFQASWCIQFSKHSRKPCFWCWPVHALYHNNGHHHSCDHDNQWNSKSNANPHWSQVFVKIITDPVYVCENPGQKGLCVNISNVGMVSFW